MTRVRVTAPRTAAQPAGDTREAAQESDVGQGVERLLPFTGEDELKNP